MATFTIAEGGSDTSFQLQYSGLDTITGSGSVPVYDAFLQTGFRGSVVTAQESFLGTIFGGDTFSLTGQGCMLNGAHTFANITYSETGGQTLQFFDTMTETVTGSVSNGASQNFSSNNHVFSDSSQTTFMFLNLSTLTYGETATESFTVLQAGTGAMACYDLSVTFSNSHGSGAFSLTLLSSSTQTGTLQQSANSSGTDSFGVAGTLISSDSVLANNNFTQTTFDTVLESESGTFGLTMNGTIATGSTIALACLSNFSLTENLSGTFSKQHLGTLNQTGLGTVSDDQAPSDQYVLNYGGVVTTIGGQAGGPIATSTNSTSVTATNSYSQTGSVSSNFTEIGVANLSYNLSSYVYSATLSNGVQTSQSNSTSVSSGTESAVADTSAGRSNLSSFGGVSVMLSPNNAGTFSGTANFTDTATQSLTETIAFSQHTYQAGTYGAATFSLSSVNYTSSSQDTWSILATDLHTQSGTDTGSSLAFAHSSGTATLGGQTVSAFPNPSFSSSNTTTFTTSAQQTTNQAGFTGKTFTEQGVYSRYSYSFSTVLYQTNQNYGQTVLSSSTSVYSGTGTQGATPSSTDGSNSSSAIGTGYGAASAALSSQQTFTQAGTAISHQTTITTDTWSIYELGSFSANTWSLSSVNYQDTYRSTYSQSNTNVALQTGTDTYSSTGTNAANGSAGYGSASNSGLGVVAQAAAGQDTFNGSSSSSVTQSGGNTFSWSRLGTYGGALFAFSSLIYQGGQTVSNTSAGTVAQTSSGSGNSTVVLSSQQSTAGTYVQAQGSSLASTIETVTQSFTSNATVNATQSATLNETTTFYEAGSWADRSYNLTSVVFTDNRLNTSASAQSSTSSKYALQTDIAVATGNASSTMFTSGGSVSGPATVNSTQTATALVTTTTFDSVSGSTGDSWAETKQGTYGNYSFAFSSYVSQDLATLANQTSVHSVSVNQTSTVIQSSSSSDSNADASVLGDDANSGRGSSTLSSTSSFNQTSQQTVTETVTSLETSSTYQAGQFSFNSFSFSSVAYSDNAGTSDNRFTSDSVTNTTQQTLTVTGTTSLTGTVALWAGSFTGVQTVNATQTVTSTQSHTNADTLNITTTDTRTLSELGCFSNYSYAYGTVTKTETATGSSTKQHAQHDTVSSTQIGTWTSLTSAMATEILGPDSAGSQDSASKSGGFTVTNQSYSGASFTLSTQSTSTGYRLGSFAGGSYAFSSVNDFSTAAQTNNSGSTASANGTVQYTSAAQDTASARTPAPKGPTAPPTPAPARTAAMSA